METRDRYALALLCVGAVCLTFGAFFVALEWLTPIGALGVGLAVYGLLTVVVAVALGRGDG